ncbi:MAG: glycosyltransferase family 9 protein [Candidatus Tectimicrobiota bacterium]
MAASKAAAAPLLPAQRILVIQFREIGDVLLSTPVLRALRQHYPQSYLAFLAEPSPGRILQGNPDLDAVLLQPRHATLRQQWQMICALRRQRFDLVVDLMGNPRSAWVARLSGARHRLAFARFPRSLCYTMLVPHQHASQEYTVSKRLRLLTPLGIATDDLTLRLPTPAEARSEVEQFLQRQAITPEDLLICIDPTHRIPTRQWPEASFSRLVDLLSNRLGARVVLLWGPGEETQVQRIAAAASSAPVLIPAWDLHTLAALLARADLCIGGNSAPLHIAVSQHTPTVTILGSTNGAGWVPPLPQHRLVAAGLPCQPCERNRCGPPLNIACLRTLEPETVFARVQDCAPWVPKLQTAQARQGWVRSAPGGPSPLHPEPGAPASGQARPPHGRLL